MENTTYDETGERRLELYHERLVASKFREHASADRLADALALTRDHALPRLGVEFSPGGGYVPGRWVSPAGLGDALETYISCLQRLERVRFGVSALIGVTDEHKKAFDAVVEAAMMLDTLGWPVNWEQNVQAILEVSEFGLKDGTLVDRFKDLADTISLRDRLTLLGTVTFYRQYRKADGQETPLRPVILTAQNRRAYSDVLLYLDRAAQARKLPQYRSEWLPRAPESR